MHGDLCKHLGIDSSTDRMIGIRSVLEYISKCAGWSVHFLFATTKDRVSRGYAYVSISISKSVSHAVTMGFVPG